MPKSKKSAAKKSNTNKSMPSGKMTDTGSKAGTKAMPAGTMIDATKPASDAEPVAGHKPAAAMPSGGMTAAPVATGDMPAGSMMSGNKPREMSISELNALTAEKAYVPKMAGLAKGAEGDEVSRLQKYLDTFGYTESASRDTFSVTAEQAAVPKPKAGKFDKSTEKALIRFQKFNELPETGILDDATLELMGKPRCGFPDTAEFTLEGRSWDHTDLTFAYGQFTPDLTQAEVRDAMRQAFDMWAAVTPLTFTEVGMGDSPDIIIRFVSGDHGDGSPFDGAGGTLAHAFYPPPNGGDLAGDAHFDDAETWSVNIPATGTDLVTVAAHEFGHSLGLAHSTDSSALMAPFYNGPHRNLEPDDIDGIQAIYGSAAPGSPNWHSLGGVITSNISAGNNADGRLEIFVRGTDNGLWHKWQTTPNNGWSGWSSLGGVITTEPVVGRNADGRLEVFARGTDGAVWHRWQTAPNNGWSGWSSLGGVITSNIAVGNNADGRMEIFARGTDNALWHKWQTAPNNGWSGWSSLGGVITSDPTITRNQDGRLEVFARGTDGAVWHRWQTAPNNGWAGWSSLGGVITSNIAGGNNADGRLEIFARGTDNALWHKWQTQPNNGWSGWSSLGGVITTDPTITSNQDGRLEVFARGTDNAVWHRWQTAPNNGWAGWSSLGGVITSEIAGSNNADGRLEIFVRGTDGAVWHLWQTSPNNGWV